MSFKVYLRSDSGEVSCLFFDDVAISIEQFNPVRRIGGVASGLHLIFIVICQSIGKGRITVSVIGVSSFDCGDKK